MALQRKLIEAREDMNRQTVESEKAKIELQKERSEKEQLEKRIAGLLEDNVRLREILKIVGTGNANEKTRALAQLSLSQSRRQYLEISRESERDAAKNSAEALESSNRILMRRLRESKSATTEDNEKVVRGLIADLETRISDLQEA